MQNNKLRLLWKYAVTYLVVIAFVLVCLSPLYYELETAATEKANQAITYAAESALHDLVQQESLLFSTARNLYNDKALRDIYYNEQESEQLFYNMTQLRTRMTLYFQTIPNVQNVTLYLPKFDYIITSDAIFSDSHRFYSYYYLDGQNPEWLHTYTRRTAGFDLFAAPLHNLLTGSNQDGLHYVFSFPMIGDGSVQMMLVVSLDAKAVAKGFLPGIEDSFAALYAADDTLLALAATQEDFTQETALAYGPKYTVFSLNGESGRRVDVGIHRSYFGAIGAATTRLVAINVLIAIACSILVSLWFAGRRAKPVQRIMAVLQKAEGLDGTRNEMQEIEGSVLELIEEIGSCKDTIGQLDTMVCRNLQDKLFLQGLGPDSETAFARYFGQMPSPFVVLACDNTALHGGALADSVQQLLVRITQQPTLAYPAVNKFYCLLAAEDAAPEAISKALRALREEGGVALKVGISKAAYALSTAAEGAKTAQRRLDAGMHITGVYVFTHTHTSVAAQATVAVQDLDTLQHTLQSGNNEAADQVLHHVFEKAQQDQWDAVELRQLFFALRTVYVGVLGSLSAQEERNGTAQKDLPTLPNDLDEYEPEILQSFFAHMNSIVCARHRKQAAVSSRTLGDDIVAYLAQNFTNSNLCASSLADVFHVSEKYVFQLVKTACGQTLNDCLITLRVEAAIALLKESRLPVAQIATQTGFVSANSMYKVFVRVKGVPPSAYRSA